MKTTNPKERKIKTQIAYYLRKKVDIQHQNISQETALHRAIAVEIYPKLTNALISEFEQFGPKAVDIENNKGMSCLCLACKMSLKQNNIEMEEETQRHLVEKLLKSGANPNHCAQKFYNFTPLHFAVTSAHINIKIISLLISHGAELHALNSFNQTPLESALLRDPRQEVIELLKPPKRIQKNSENKNTLIEALKIKSTPKRIQTLLASSFAELNQMDELKRTPLHIACEMDQDFEIIKILCEKGDSRNLNHLDHKQRTPLHLACKTNKDTEILEYLIGKNNDANINKRDKKGKTPLFHLCSNSTPNIQKITLFLKLGADLNIPNNKGYCCLHQLCCQKNCSLDIFKQVLDQKDINIDIETRKGRTPLFFAILYQDLPVIHLLLEKGADINRCDYINRTPLHFAVQKRCDLKITKWLIRYGADLDAQDWAKMSSLHFACRKRKVELVNVLLASGANPNITNSLEETALFILIRENSDNPKILQIAELLVLYGANIAHKNLQDVTAIKLGKAIHKNETNLVRFLVQKSSLKESKFNYFQKDRKVLSFEYSRNKHKYDLCLLKDLMRIFINQKVCNLELIPEKIQLHKALVKCRVINWEKFVEFCKINIVLKNQKSDDLISRKILSRRFDILNKFLWWVYGGVIANDFQDEVVDLGKKMGMFDLIERSGHNGMLIDLAEMFLDNEDKKLTIMSCDGHQIQIHKELVFARSRLFAEIIQKYWDFDLSEFKSRNENINENLSQHDMSMLSEKVVPMFSTGANLQPISNKRSRDNDDSWEIQVEKERKKKEENQIEKKVDVMYQEIIKDVIVDPTGKNHKTVYELLRFFYLEQFSEDIRERTLMEMVNFENVFKLSKYSHLENVKFSAKNRLLQFRKERNYNF
eukprot:Anaeramoba_ignava/a607393_59.p1 GENE.a607393_59~~a607393_59.p1  ORF type:complete len:878 (-),score=272.98 a607393_59:29-2662(-)